MVTLRGVLGRTYVLTTFQEEMDKAIRNQANVIVLDIEVNGGRISDAEAFVAEIIRRSVKFRFVALVRQAYSAGAAVALCCGKIFMTETGALGAATSSTTGKIDPELAVRATSLQAAWAAICKKAAEHGGHPPILAEAMADPDMVLTMAEKDGRLTFEKDGAGTTVKAKDRLLKLTGRQAVACGLAAGTATTPESLAELLNETKWVSAGTSAPTTSGGATSPGPDTPSAAAVQQMFTKKVAELGLSGELTTIQREYALKQLAEWFKGVKLDGQRVRWAVDVTEAYEDKDSADKEALKQKIDDAKRSLRSAQARLDFYRNSSDFGSTVPAGVIDDVRRWKSRIDALNAAMDRSAAYPYIVIGHASDAPRIEITAQVHHSAAGQILKARPGSKLVLEGVIDRVRLDKDELADTDFPIRILLKNADAPAE